MIIHLSIYYSLNHIIDNNDKDNDNNLMYLIRDRLRRHNSLSLSCVDTLPGFLCITYLKIPPPPPKKKEKKISIRVLTERQHKPTLEHP